MVTPLLDNLRTQGGTLYTFSSAARDLTRTFSDDRFEFKFSHFACLNIPDIKNIKGNSKYDFTQGNPNNYEKGLYLNALITESEFESFHNTNSMFQNDSVGINLALAENIQNYVMNFETALLNGMGDNDDYDKNQLRTTSERVFFNWLQKVGAIEFKGNAERYVDSTYFTEMENDFADRVVKYIGYIDVINSVDVCGDAYNEVYIHIPGSVGGSDKVKFFTVNNDSNYVQNKSYRCEGTKIIGRENIESPYGLSLNAIYDGSKSYTSDLGYCIDFRKETYSGDGGIMGMNENSPYDFEFNCVLVYYTMKNRKTGEAATNLYGVMFLEEITNINGDDPLSLSTSRGYIQRYPKIAGGNIGNGNSYSLKLDLKIDTLPDTTMTPQTYKDPNEDYSLAMELLNDGIFTQLHALVLKVLEDKKEINSLKERINYLEDQLSLINQIPTLESEIVRLNDIIDYSDIVIDGKNILKLIELNSNRINSLIKGNISAKLSVDASAINKGYGIDINSDDDGRITINNKLGAYNIISFTNNDEKIDNDNYVQLNTTMSTNGIYLNTVLLEGSNFGVLYVEGVCNTDININIDDTLIKWKTGQSMKIKINHKDNYFDVSKTKSNSSIDPILKIFCGDVDITNGNIKLLDYKGLDSIEIICIDENASEYSKKFIYDIKTR